MSRARGPFLESPETMQFPLYLKNGEDLRTVPAIVNAHTFCASRDTRSLVSRTLLPSPSDLIGRKSCS